MYFVISKSAVHEYMILLIILVVWFEKVEDDLLQEIKAIACINYYMRYVEQIPTVLVTFVQATFVFCDICPYQECPSSNWPNYDETLEVGFWEY